VIRGETAAAYLASVAVGMGSATGANAVPEGNHGRDLAGSGKPVIRESNGPWTQQADAGSASTTGTRAAESGDGSRDRGADNGANGAGTPVSKLVWPGHIPYQKWSNVYLRVLSKRASAGTLQVRVRVEATSESGSLGSRVAEIRAALRELGLDERLEELSG
jgi:hypothetical protein